MENPNNSCTISVQSNYDWSNLQPPQRLIRSPRINPNIVAYLSSDVLPNNYRTLTVAEIELYMKRKPMPWSVQN